MTVRERFCQIALKHIGDAVVWNQKGPNVFDCSGLVTFSLWAAGGPDFRVTHNSQRLANGTPNIITGPVEARPGDLVFFGHDFDKVSHVGIWMAGGHCLSADGATPKIKDLATALSFPTHRVRLHDSVLFRKDLPWHAIHINTHLDKMDKGASVA